MKKPRLESSIQASIMRTLRNTPNTWVVKYQGNYRGAPDLICLYKGYFIGFEVKRKKNFQVSPSQKIQKSLIEACGGFYYIVDSVNSVKIILGNFDEKTISQKNKKTDK